MKLVVLRNGILFALLIGLVCIFISKKKDYDVSNNDTFTKGIIGKPINYNIYKENILNGADPILYENMIAVNYVGGGWEKADLTNEWYSYENFNWANAVVIKNNKKDFYNTADAVTQILKEDVLGFFVWIPRFEYKLFNVEFKPVEEQMIEVRFVNKNSKKNTIIKNGLFYTHPAFSTSSGELNGFWIAKFEPSLNNGVIEILSNKETLVNLNMAEMWKYAIGVSSSYDLSVPSRIITNMEYGAIATLTYSQYGKRNNESCNGLERLVFLNTAMGNSDWDRVFTGCSAGTAVNGASYRCPYSYDYPYYGTGASSTGTIYGIYDLAGGSWKCVMGIVSDYPIKNYLGGYNGMLLDNKRYYTFYKASNMYDYSKSIAGDMMGEVISISDTKKTWNGNNAYFATSSYPWVKRGGSFRGGSYPGIFDFGITDAIKRGDKTFRVILSEY